MPSPIARPCAFGGGNEVALERLRAEMMYWVSAFAASKWRMPPSCLEVHESQVAYRGSACIGPIRESLRLSC